MLCWFLISDPILQTAYRVVLLKCVAAYEDFLSSTLSAIRKYFNFYSSHTSTLADAHSLLQRDKGQRGEKPLLEQGRQRTSPENSVIQEICSFRNISLHKGIMIWGSVDLLEAYGWALGSRNPLNFAAKFCVTYIFLWRLFTVYKVLKSAGQNENLISAFKRSLQKWHEVIMLIPESYLFHKVQDALMATLARGFPAQHHVTLGGLSDREVCGRSRNNTLWKTTRKVRAHTLGNPGHSGTDVSLSLKEDLVTAL